MDEDKLTNEFSNSLNTIACNLANKWNLTHTQHTTDSCLLRWLDFVNRYILLNTRQTLYSNVVKSKINYSNKKLLRRFEQLIYQGCDLNPYQTKRLIQNDTGESKRLKRTDLLLSDWGIFHFHLTEIPIPSSEYFLNRSDWLIFCLIDYTTIKVIDIQNHRATNYVKDFLKIIDDNWPYELNKYELKGILSSHKKQDEDIEKCRKHGLSYIATINGRNLALGVSSAGTSDALSLQMGHIKRFIRFMANCISNRTNQHILNFLYGISNPEIEIQLFNEGLGLYEKKSKRTLLFNRNSYYTREFGESQLSTLIAPDWALLKLN